MRIAIIDDDKDFREMFEVVLQNYFKNENLDITISKFAALNEYRKKEEEFDYLFLDILFDEEECFKDINKCIKRNMREKIIFITSREYLVYEACHLKPFDFIRKDMLNNEIKLLVSKMLSYYVEENKIFEFDVDSKKIKIFANNIMYFEINVNDLTITTKQHVKLKCRHSLKKLQEYINKNHINGFVKINKSMIINTKFCTDIKNDKVEIDRNTNLPIAVNKRNKIRNEIIQQIIQLY